MNPTYTFSLLGVLLIAIALMLYRMRDKIPARTMILVILLGGSITLLMAYPVPRRKAEKSKKQEEVKSPIKTRKLKGITECSCTFRTIKLKRDDYRKKHLPHAMRLTKNAYIYNERNKYEYLRKGQLVEVNAIPGIHFENMKNSSRHLTPLAYRRLKELSSLFRAYLKGTKNERSKFVISSMTRSEEQQEVIRRRFPKTCTYGKTTHGFGVAFDINKIQSPTQCNSCSTALQKALTKMQKEGKLMICPESGCIHITITS